MQFQVSNQNPELEMLHDLCDASGLAQAALLFTKRPVRNVLFDQRSVGADAL